MVLCLGESPGGFCDVGCCCCCFPRWRFFIHFLSSFCCCCSSSFHFQAALACRRHSTLASQARRPPPALSSIPTTFDCLCFSSTASAMVLSGDFSTHRRFLPYAPSSTFLTHPAFIKASLGAGSSSLKFSKHRPGLPVCLIQQQPTIFIFRRIHFKIRPYISMNYLW